MPLAADAKEELVGDRFQGKMVTTGPSNPIVKRPVRKPTEYVKTALRELRQGGLVQLLNNVQEGRTSFVSSQKGVDPSSVATYFHSPSPFTFFFYHYPGSDAVLLIWNQWEGAVSAKKLGGQKMVLLDMIAIAEGEGIKLVRTIKAQGVDQLHADRLREEAFSTPDKALE